MAGAVACSRGATAVARPEGGPSGKDWEIGRIGGLAFSPDGFVCVAGGEEGRPLTLSNQDAGGWRCVIASDGVLSYLNWNDHSVA